MKVMYRRVPKDIDFSFKNIISSKSSTNEEKSIKTDNFKYLEKLDVVYTLRDASKHGDDFELRHSLRSIDKQSWLNRVILIGHRPKWVKNVIHVPYEDLYPQKHKDKNIIFKVLRACAIPDITDRFIVWSDDIYALRPLTLEDFGPWLEYPSQYEKIKDTPIDQINSTWKQRLVQTVEYCKRNGYPTFTPDFHVPYIVDKRLYLEVMLDIPWHIGNGLLTHVFMNVLVKRGKLKHPVLNKNVILRIQEDYSEEDLQLLLKNKLFLNHNNNGLGEGMKRFLEKKFFRKSSYE